MRINLHEELRSHFLYIAKSIQTIVCLHLSFIVYKLLYFLLFILHLISQVHYINNVTFHKKKSHAIHTNLIVVMEGDLRQTANTKADE